MVCACCKSAIRAQPEFAFGIHAAEAAAPVWFWFKLLLEALLLWSCARVLPVAHHGLEGVFCLTEGFPWRRRVGSGRGPGVAAGRELESFVWTLLWSAASYS